MTFDTEPAPSNNSELVVRFSVPLGIFGFVSWLLVIARYKHPFYRSCAIEWRRFNAWVQARSPAWTELIAVLIVLVFYFESTFRLGSAAGPNGACARFGINLLTVEAKQWWRFLTAPLVHADLAHVIGNILCLWLLGRWVQAIAPRNLVPLLLLLGAIVGYLTAMLSFSVKLSVGLSGGIMCLQGFLIVAWVRAKAFPPFLGGALLIFSLVSLASDFIASEFAQFAAHAGGMLTGIAVAGHLLRNADRVPISMPNSVGALGLLCGSTLVASGIVISVLLA